MLKYEAYHDSALARLLLRRALLSPLILGHPLFWMLHAEMHIPVVQERFGVLLSVYLTRYGLGGHLMCFGVRGGVERVLGGGTRWGLVGLAALPFVNHVFSLHLSIPPPLHMTMPIPTPHIDSGAHMMMMITHDDTYQHITTHNNTR